MGAGIIPILTAECTEKRREKQKCSANFRGFAITQIIYFNSYIYHGQHPPLPEAAARMHCTRAQAMGSCGRGGRVIEDAFHITVGGYLKSEHTEDLAGGTKHRS